MTYQEICSRNKFLYEELEKITRLLQFASELNMDLDTTDLLHRKEHLKESINENLEKLEEYWTVGALRAGNYRVVVGPEFGRQRDQIITMYKRNPNLSVNRIAHELELSYSVVTRAITEFLTKKEI